MTEFRRFGIYALPEGAFFDAASAWLGWNSVLGQEVAHPEVAGLPARVEDITATPRKYGFHGTIKPPFFLAAGGDLAALKWDLAALCTRLAPVELPELAIRRLGGFVAAVPGQPSAALADLAATFVQDLDGFRAPPSDAELAKRRTSRLNARQEELLIRWGYPYVLDQFRFHLTLSGKLPQADAERLAALLMDHFAPLLPRPYRIADMALMGEARDGRFHLIHRYTLTG